MKKNILIMAAATLSSVNLAHADWMAMIAPQRLQCEGVQVIKEDPFDDQTTPLSPERKISLDLSGELGMGKDAASLAFVYTLSYTLDGESTKIQPEAYSSSVSAMLTMGFSVEARKAGVRVFQFVTLSDEQAPLREIKTSGDPSQERILQGFVHLDDSERPFLVKCRATFFPYCEKYDGFSDDNFCSQFLQDPGAPVCKARTPFDPATVECACKANQRIVQRDGVMSCEAWQSSYPPSGCSLDSRTKIPSGCKCDRPLNSVEANEIYENNGVDEPVSVYSYILNQTHDLCERVEWFFVGNLVQCGPNAKAIVADVSRSFQVLDSEVKKGKYAKLGACGLRTDDQLWIKIYSKDHNGVSSLIQSR